VLRVINDLICSSSSSLTLKHVMVEFLLFLVVSVDAGPTAGFYAEKTCCGCDAFRADAVKMYTPCAPYPIDYGDLQQSR
jgi:hypothetical protein